MSIRAIKWAMEQKTDGPSAQAVLFIIADRANEHGVCRHADPDTIAKQTRQSRATVFRRLEELERAGMLARFTRHLENGRREYEIRLTIDRMFNYRVDRDRRVVVYAYDDDAGMHPIREIAHRDDGDGSQIETEPQSQIETESVSPVRPTQSHSCDPQKESQDSQEDSPPPTPSPDGEGGTPCDQGQQPGEPDGWREFERAFTADGEPMVRVSLGRQLFAALAPDERALVTRAAAGLIAFRRGQKKPAQKPSVQTFVRERDAWPGWAKHAPVPPPPRTWIAEGSPAFAALAVLAAIASDYPPQARTDPDRGERGCWHLGEPPGPDMLALAPFAGCELPAVVVEGEREFGVWVDRIRAWTGRVPPLRKIFLPETRTLVVNGAPMTIQRSVMGLRVPARWPPRKDGTWAEG